MKEINFIYILLMINGSVIANGLAADTVRFIGNELLSRPTSSSININLCAEREIEAYVEYGTEKSMYPNKTSVETLVPKVPFNFLLKNLLPSKKYFYRVIYRLKGSTEFISKAEYTFTTQRTKESSFSFAVQADPHLDYNTSSDLLRRSLLNVLETQNDFLVDLGDNFMSEKENSKSYETTLQRHLLLRGFYDSVCHSIPLFLVLGNHEGEQGSDLNGTENCLPVWATKIRKLYYPNPAPDDFYSGNSKDEMFVGLRENYYSFVWGNALFVVLDPYWYTTERRGDNWRFTLGDEQYKWFKNVLENSNTKFKFVFCHQILGGKDSQGRGGSDYARFYEMGGENADGSWGFTAYRNGWDLPIHQLMVKNKVNIFFHGHDHFYAKQEKDGIIYQLVPQPGYPGNKSTENASDYGYVTGTFLPSSGFLKVTVSDSKVKVDYIKALLPSMESQSNQNGMIVYSYSIPENNFTGMESGLEIPTGFSLEQNYPNPFNPSTVIRYELPVDSFVSFKVFDVSGKEIVTLINELKPAGIHQLEFNILNYHLSSGIYFYRINTPNFSKTLKMICLK